LRIRSAIPCRFFNVSRCRSPLGARVFDVAGLVSSVCLDAAAAVTAVDCDDQSA